MIKNCNVKYKNNVFSTHSVDSKYLQKDNLKHMLGICMHYLTFLFSQIFPLLYVNSLKL